MVTMQIDNLPSDGIPTHHSDGFACVYAPSVTELHQWLALHHKQKKSVWRGILEYILSAKKEETRARRVEETTRLASLGKRLFGPSGKKNV